jgi:hypothetical protein
MEMLECDARPGVPIGRARIGSYVRRSGRDNPYSTIGTSIDDVGIAAPR